MMQKTLYNIPKHCGVEAVSKQIKHKLLWNFHRMCFCCYHSGMLGSQLPSWCVVVNVYAMEKQQKDFPIFLHIFPSLLTCCLWYFLHIHKCVHIITREIGYECSKNERWKHQNNWMEGINSAADIYVEIKSHGDVESSLKWTAAKKFLIKLIAYL